MATDYILFIHGVNTREVREQPEYADSLFKLIQKTVFDRKPDVQKIVFWMQGSDSLLIFCLT